MDQTDKTLLEEIQRNADRSSRDLGELVGLSAGAVHRRLKRLRDQGYVLKTSAIVDRNKVGLDILCFLMVRFKNNMSPVNLAHLREAVHTLPEVLECYTTTGANDAILKVAVPDHNALKALLQELAESQTVIDRVYTSLALDEIKNVTELPVSEALLARSGPVAES